MKSLILAFAFFSVFTQFAEARVAPAPQPLIASVSGSLYDIELVNVFADGRMQIHRRGKSTIAVDLTDSALAKVKESAAQLADVTVKTTDSLTVCMMMPRPDLNDLSISGYDLASGAFDGNPRLVLTADNCSISHHVIPTDAERKSDAKALRAQIVVLALNAL